MDGKLHLYKRKGSRFWQCSTYLAGRNHRQTTGEESLVFAKEFARDWYMERYAEERRRRRGLASTDPVMAPSDGSNPPLPPDRRRRPAADGPTFKQAAAAFLKEAELITEGERALRYIPQKQEHVRLHLMPFFGEKALSEVTAGLVQDYRVHRVTTNRHHRTGTPHRPARSTLENEIITLRQILKTANRKGWLAALPDMSAPYKSSGKVKHRAWFSPEEYKQLYEASRDRARNPKQPRARSAGETLHDYILFMVNTGLRPDEALGLEYRDVEVVTDEVTSERILEIKVRGKRGFGYCKSTRGAVVPFQRLRQRANGQPTDKLFPAFNRYLFNTLLEELNMRQDREGQRRTPYSLRHTYICLRLMEGADIYQIAKNCRTSVKMIETFYAAHIANTLDTAAINVRKPKPPGRAARKAGGERAPDALA